MYAVFARPVVWHGLVRAVLFIGLAKAFGVLLSRILPFANPGVLAEVFQEVARGTYERVSDRAVAFALASLVAQVAASLAITFFLTHVLLIRLTELIGDDAHRKALCSQRAGVGVPQDVEGTRRLKPRQR